MPAEDRQRQRDREQHEVPRARAARRDETERQHHRRQAEREEQPDDVKGAEGVGDGAEDRRGLADALLAQKDEGEEEDEEEPQRSGEREGLADRQEQSEEREGVEDRGLLVGEERRAGAAEAVPERQLAAQQRVARDPRPRRELREDDAGVRVRGNAARGLPRIRVERARRNVDAIGEERRRLVRRGERDEERHEPPRNAAEPAIPDRGHAGAAGDEERGGHCPLSLDAWRSSHSRLTCLRRRTRRSIWSISAARTASTASELTSTIRFSAAVRCGSDSM